MKFLLVTEEWNPAVRARSWIQLLWPKKLKLANIELLSLTYYRGNEWILTSKGKTFKSPSVASTLPWNMNWSQWSTVEFDSLFIPADFRCNFWVRICRNRINVHFFLISVIDLSENTTLYIFRVKFKSCFISIRQRLLFTNFATIFCSQFI